MTSPLLEPKEVQIPTEKGERTFILSKFPAIAGRRIVTQYPTTAMPKVGDYKTNEDLMVELLGYVEAVTPEGENIRLSSRALIDNHVPDFEALMRLEWAMMEYNCSFFRNGALSGLAERAIPALSRMISQTLTDLLERSQERASPPSTS